jgi:hypothetical protein
MTTRTVYVPFYGFYDWLGEFVTNMLYELQEDNIRLLPPDFEDQLDWQAIEAAYVAEWVKTINSCLNTTITVDKVEHPREYNFSNDRIKGTIPLDQVFRLFNAIDLDDLNKVVRDRHTSYDGFISFYDNQYQTWGGVSTWDENQLETLIMAYMYGSYGADTYWMERMHEHVVYDSLNNELVRQIEILVPEFYDETARIHSDQHLLPGVGE